MKACFRTQPEEHRKGFRKFPRFYFEIRLDGWKLDRHGLHRWWTFTAAKPNAKGIHATRYGWKRMELIPSFIRVFRAFRGSNSHS